MDDDDYYPPERVEHAVEKLTEHKEAMAAGSSEIYIYFKDLKRMVQCGPYRQSHATAGTFAFRTELLKETRYDDHAALAEEKSFLKDYTVPFVQLDPMKTILVFSHPHNTFDKKKMLDSPNQFMKDSPKRVEDFIRYDYEAPIKKFFMNDIDQLLKNYKPGEPAMKPDVLEQMKVIEKQREDMQKQAMANAMAQGEMPVKVMLNRPGMEPAEISIPDLMNIMNQMQNHLNELIQKTQSQSETIQTLQKQLQIANTTIASLKKNIEAKPSTGTTNQSPSMVGIPIPTQPTTSKLEPAAIYIDISD
jgi:hypothetical protein